MTLTQPVLQLNTSWVPVSTVTVKEALCQAYGGTADIIDPHTYMRYKFHEWSELSVLKDKPKIHTATMVFRMPEIVVLTNYHKTPSEYLAFTRKNIYERDKYQCQYCGAKPGSKELSIDHITPRSKGGATSWTNCVLSCVSCNHKKGDKDLSQCNMKLRKKPIKPKWSPKMVLASVRNIPISWKGFVDDAYWNQELEQ